jgi:WD40 repeat protein
VTGHDGRVAAVACTELDGVPVAVTGRSDKTARVWNLCTRTTTTLLTPSHLMLSPLSDLVVGFHRDVAVSRRNDTTAMG